MKHIKHWLATIAVLLCSITASAHDFEVGGIYYNITSSTDLTVAVTYRGSYDDSYSNEYSGAVTIPSTVTYYRKTYSVTSIGNDAFRNCSSLTSITLPEGVTSIGSFAFSDCSSLTAITIPESVTSIGGYAFAYCSSLTDITIPEGVTSIGGYAFAYCRSLTSITIPENSQLTSIGYDAFYICSSLTSITLPESVTSIGERAFYNCSRLTSITLPEGVTSIGDYTFDGCSSLTSITIPENSQLTSIGDYAFRYCESLTTITIPEGVTSIGENAFDGCSSLNSITIPEGVASIGYEAFRGCSSIASIVVLAGNSVYDSRGGCNAIIVTSCDSLIRGCSSTIIPEGVTGIGDYAFDGCSSLTAINIPASVTGIGDYAFYDCSSLTAINIPESVTSIGRSAFCGCSSLTAITLPEGVASIGYCAFEGCSSLTAVHISNIEAWCKISFSSFTSNPLCYGKNLYLNGELVTELVVPESVTSIGNYAFYDCCSLTSITIPDGVTSIGNYAFYDCRSLTAITIPASVTSIGDDIGSSCRVFSNCTSLKEVIFEDGTETLAVGCDYFYLSNNPRISGRGLFYDCPLEKVYLGRNLNYDTGLRAGYSPFYDKGTLTSLTIGPEVTEIGANAFSGCSAIDTITSCAMTPPTCASNAFRGVDTSIPVYVPEGSVADYQAAEVWKGFFNFVGADLTGIDNLEPTDNGEQQAVIYDLMGRRVANPTKGGIYIVNGSKVVIK